VLKLVTDMNLVLKLVTDMNIIRVDGQPESIVQDIENMVRSYVEKVSLALSYY
jgi:hypothetical protein